MTETEQALSKLEGVKKIQGGWQAKCPCHDDKHQSLSIAEKDSKLMLYCHAGCSFESIIKVLDLQRERETDTPQTITATYDYTDSEGNILYQVVRYNPKAFRQRRPVNGGWEWNLNGIKPTLYKLPEVINAIKEKRIIWIVEGEKDVDNLCKQGQVATSISGGASTKWPPNLVPIFFGIEVAIIPDQDEPGKKYAQYLGNLLYGIARSVKIVSLPSKDVSDYLHSSPMADLIDLYREAREFIPSGVVTREEFNELRGLNIYLLRSLMVKKKDTRKRIYHDYDI